MGDHGRGAGEGAERGGGGGRRGGGGEGEEAGEEGEKGRERMMLRIEGCEVGDAVTWGQKDDGVEVEELVGRFEKGMGELRRVVGRGGKGG